MTYHQIKPPGKLLSVITGMWPILLLISVILISGLLMGSLAAGKLDHAQSQDLSIYLKEFIQKVSGINFDSAKIAKNSMINNTIMIAAIYVLGLTVIGIPLILTILFVRSFIIGFAVGFLTKDLSLGGILLTISAILPHSILSLPALCIGSSASVMFSVLLLKRNFNTSVKIWPNLITYTMIMVGVLAITLVSGLVEGYITPIFTKIAADLIISRFGIN